LGNTALSFNFQFIAFGVIGLIGQNALPVEKKLRRDPEPVKAKRAMELIAKEQALKIETACHLYLAQV